jgi:Caspase domain
MTTAMIRLLIFKRLLALLLTATSSFAGELSSQSEAQIDVVQQMLREDRVALVIGNVDYQQWPSLANPVNDARSMAQTLQRFGFKVSVIENGSKEQMEGAIRLFGDQAKRGGVALFFYAGHGTQYRGQNYLIPTDADILTEEDIEARGVSARGVVSRMGKANNRLNIVILDACRTLPIKRQDRDAGSGLAPMKASGTLIAYATAPNFVAKDGKGSNSPYTKSLVDAINKYPGLKLEDMLKTVRAAVLRETGGVQEPWIESSIGGDFYFDPKQASNSTVIYNPAPAVGGQEQPADDRSTQIPRWREVGTGFFSQTTDDFNEEDVRVALALQGRLDALSTKVMKWAQDPVLAMTSTSINTAIAHAQVECYRLISTKRLAECDASLKKVEVVAVDLDAPRQAGQADDKKSADKLAEMAEAIVEATRTGKPSMVLVPFVFGSYNGNVTQEELNRGWSLKQRLAVICMDAFRKRATAPESHNKCQDQSYGIENLVSTKQLDEAAKQLARLALEIGM